MNAHKDQVTNVLPEIAVMEAVCYSVVCYREVLYFLTCPEDVFVSPNQEHLDREKIQGWTCEQTEQVLIGA